jgi:hypothetical protein
LGAGVYRCFRRRLRHNISAVGPEIPSTKKRPLGTPQWSAARHSDRRFVACSFGWDDVSLSSATTAVAASDCYVILVAITANALAPFNAAFAGARRDYQTISVAVTAFLHLLTR